MVLHTHTNTRVHSSSSTSAIASGWKQESRPQRRLEESWASCLHFWLEMCVEASRWMRSCKHQLGLWKCERLFCEASVRACGVDYSCDQFHVEWIIVICVLVFLHVVLFPRQLHYCWMYIHPSQGESCHRATHPLILRLFQWSNKNSCLASALKINSSIGTGRLCTTWTQRQKQMTGQHTARRGQGSSVGRPRSVFHHVGTTLWRKTDSTKMRFLLWHVTCTGI